MAFTNVTIYERKYDTVTPFCVIITLVGFMTSLVTFFMNNRMDQDSEDLRARFFRY
jgi:hypothetical protein